MKRSSIIRNFILIMIAALALLGAGVVLDKDASIAYADGNQFTGVLINDTGNVVLLSDEETSYDYLTFTLVSGNQYSVSKNGTPEGSIIIPSTYNDLPVTTISSNAFKDCIGLTEIVIPNSVTSIGASAFNGCSGLTSMVLPFVGNSRTASSSLGLLGYIFGSNSYEGGVETIQSYLSSGASKTGTYYIPTMLRKIEITGATKLGYGAFDSCNELTEVKLNNGIVNIETYAFRGCTGLTEIIIPNSVTNLGASAFNTCISLSEVIIPNGVTSIGTSAFYDCTGLSEIIISESVTCIESSVFSGCKGLTKIVIPNNVISIGSSAFSGCTGLSEIIIPNSVTSIGASAFSGCSGLESMVLPFVGTSRTAINSSGLFGYIFGTSAYEGGVETKQAISMTSNVIYYIPAALRKVEITDATKLGYGAFDTCSGLTEVILNNGIINIESYVFRACKNLNKITIPNGMASIGDFSFSGCTSLSKVEMKAGVTSIGASTFKDCIGLTEIVIPNSVTTIGASAFSGCSGLEGMVLPFVGNSRTASSSLGLLGYIFGSNSYEGGVKTIQSYLSSGASKTGTYYIPTMLKKLEITDATKLNYGAFDACNMLTEIILNNEITSIGTYAFRNCTELTEITIPENVTSIGSNAFDNCTSLKYVVVERENPITILSGNAFNNCTSLVNIYVPHLSVENYKNASYWKNYKLIIRSVMSVVSYVAQGAELDPPYTLVRFNDAEYELVIPVREGYNFSGWYSDTNGKGTRYSNELGEGLGIIIPDDITLYAFWTTEDLIFVLINGGREYEVSAGLDANYSEVYIPEYYNNLPVTKIASYGFAYCENLQIIHLPQSITVIGSFAFSNCISLTSFVMPDSVTEMQRGAFEFSGLISMILSENLTEISAGAFAFCENLVEITLHEGIKTIKQTAFNYTALESIILPNSLTVIEAGAFAFCFNLVDITIPGSDSIVTITANTFVGTNLINIYVNDSIVDTYKTATNWSVFATIIKAIIG